METPPYQNLRVVTPGLMHIQAITLSEFAYFSSCLFILIERV